MLVNPAVHTERKDRHLLPLLRHVVKAFPGIVNDIKKPGQDEGGYDQAAAAVRLLAAAGLGRRSAPTSAKVTAPVLAAALARGPRRRAQQLRLDPRATSRSPDVTEVWLEDSYHVATLDNDAPLIFDASVDFVRRVAPAAVRRVTLGA